MLELDHCCLYLTGCYYYHPYIITHACSLHVGVGFLRVPQLIPAVHKQAEDGEGRGINWTQDQWYECEYMMANQLSRVDPALAS